MTPSDPQPTPAVPEPTPAKSIATVARAVIQAVCEEHQKEIADLKAALAAERDNRLAADEAMVTLHGALEKAETELATERERAEKAEAELSAVDNVLARRPVLADFAHRWEKIEHAIATAKRADGLAAEVEGLRRGLESIRVRCREGDKRADWLPVIDGIARQLLGRPT